MTDVVRKRLLEPEKDLIDIKNSY